MTSLIAIGAGIAALTGIGAGIGIGLATSKATDAIARQPEADGKITKALLLGCALAEGTAIFGMVVAILIISPTGTLIGPPAATASMPRTKHVLRVHKQCPYRSRCDLISRPEQNPNRAKSCSVDTAAFL